MKTNAPLGGSQFDLCFYGGPCLFSGHAVGEFDYGKATACRQFGFKWFEGVDLYRSLVEAPVRGVGFLCVGKRGEACSAVRLAALNAWRFSFLSWKK